MEQKKTHGKLSRWKKILTGAAVIAVILAGVYFGAAVYSLSLYAWDKDKRHRLFNEKTRGISAGAGKNSGELYFDDHRSGRKQQHHKRQGY